MHASKSEHSLADGSLLLEETQEEFEPAEAVLASVGAREDNDGHTTLKVSECLPVTRKNNLSENGDKDDVFECVCRCDR